MDRIVVAVGSCTLGIYVLHVLFLIEFPLVDPMLRFLLDTLAFNPMLAAFIVCFAVFSVCFIITLIMKKIPLLNRLL